MLTPEKVSRREFNKKLSLILGGGLVFMAGCSDNRRTPEIVTTPETLVRWSKIDVPFDKAIHASVKGLDSSQLGVTDLFVHSNHTEAFVWFAVVLQKPNPNIFDIEFYLTPYQDNFVLSEDVTLINRPPVETIPDQSGPNALVEIDRAIPVGSDILKTRPIDVMTPIIKPSDKNDYVFVYKSSNPQYQLEGFVPIKLSFESLTRAAT